MQVAAIESAVALSRECGPLNELEAIMAAHPNRKDAKDFPTTHCWTDGLYSRTVILEPGESCVSRIHLTEHQFVISDGVCKIWSPRLGWEVVRSPHLGVTKIGDRRAVVALCRTCWTTVHSNIDNEQSVEVLERRLFA